MKKFILRYKVFIILLFVNLVLLIAFPTLGLKSFSLTGQNLLEMLSIIPPVFILLGLLDVWVQRETMIKWMGEKSGFKGMAIAFFLGSAAAGPLYAAFPIAGVLLKKGSKLSNVLIFIGAWSTTKIPMLLFEASSMGWKFMVTRFVVDLFGIAAIAFITEKAMNKKDIQDIYEKAGKEIGQ
jgi:uncharacterized membrane protein YraQ (UPF0718 family)